MCQNFYVDDCLCTVHIEGEAKEQIDSLHQACTKGGFRLTKFICNRRSVLESIPKEERSKYVKTLDLNYDELPIECALGVQWCVVSNRVQTICNLSDPSQWKYVQTMENPADDASVD